MNPKIGPRGITIQDVRRVANNGLPKEEEILQPLSGYTPPTDSSTPTYNPQLLAALMAGQAQPSYGEKYGGFSTREMLNDAALGYALNFRDIADFAANKAAELNAPWENKLTSVYNIADASENSVNETAKERARQRDIRSAFGFNQPSAIMDFAGQKQAQAEANRLAVVAKMKSDAESEYNNYYNTQVLPYQQIADTIYDTPVSQLARQALTTQYGVDPNVARATFTEQTDLDYAKLLRDSELAAEGIDFSMSEGEMIYNSQGPEAYKVYQEQKIYDAQYGTPAEQAQAQQDLIDSQNAPVDAEIFNDYGIRPKEVTGADADTVRALFLDPEFMSAWIMPSIEELEANDGYLSGADIAGQQASKYLEQNPNNILIAKTLAAIIAEFDFLSR
ncbi:hypothetical protein UFOVP366_32 [uncultured Caudovirales phage]|uniref:Uncharacterized protein n=1 Tax=uncultured Caudovirales phage TaxID=2100421 RepID=A0A6J7X1M7_9CAUD|nr:hypothetical protein UFOVP366_32 [uncultured Caudovirales phage]